MTGAVRPVRKGQKSAPAPRTPIEEKDSLRSKAVARVQDAVAEGLCVGLVDGPKSIYLNGTPLMNADGTVNFPGVTWDFRHGFLDQPHMAGFPEVESEISVEAQVYASRPVTRRIENTLAGAVRVTVTVPSIFDQNTTTGDTTGTRIDFVVRIRRTAAGSPWRDYALAIVGKQTGPYQEAYRLDLPGTGPWDVQVARSTPDSTRATLQNDLIFASYTEIIEHKLSYQGTAYVGLTFDAELFGNQIPQRSYDWKGWTVRVPSNYDAEGRVYTGLWDGSYKAAWTDNPAWLLLHLLTHPRGAGLSDAQVDRFGLYTLGRYCDEMVPDGFGAFEPRFTANFCLNTREEAYAVINALASTMRAMVYWATGAVQVVGDMPTDPSVLVTKANTIGGYEYSGTGLKSRHTACAVSFLDRADNYDRSIEVYEDPQGIEKYGYNLAEVTAFACTSRGQAARVARWLVETEKAEGDSLTYKASLDHVNVVPGAVVAVADPEYAGVRFGGRVVSATPTMVQVDAPVTLEAGQSYRLKVVLPDLTVHERPVLASPGTTATLRLSGALPAAPQAEAQWVLLASNLEPRQFRVISVAEDNDLEYQVVTVSHDPTKYARIEQGVVLNRPPFSRLPDPGVVQPPGAVSVARDYISTPGGWTVVLTISWLPAPDPYVRGYVVRYRRNNGNWQTLPETPATTFALTGEDSAGRFEIHVFAVNFVGVQSRPSILSVNVLDSSPITMIRPSGLELEGQGNDTVFGGRNPKFTWRGTALRGAFPMGEEPAAGAGYLDSIFRDYEVRVVAPNGRLVFTDHTVLNWYAFDFEKNATTPGGPHRAFRFEVYMRDRWGNVSLPAALDVSNPSPAQPTNLSVEPGLGGVFIKYDRPADIDYQGTLAWMGTETGFATTAEAVVYDGDSTFTFVKALESSVRFLRIAAYDSFGKTGLNVSPEFRVVIGGVRGPDFIPPTVPGGLALSTSSSVAPDGTRSFTLHAAWTGAADDDFLFYGVGIAEDQGNFVFSTTDQPRYDWPVRAGATYRVKLRSTDNLGNSSVYGPESSITVPGTGIAPRDPIDLTVIPGSLRTVWLTWSQHPDPDWDFMEVWEASVNDRTQAVHLHNAGGTTFARQGLPAGATRYYWIRAANRSKVVSGFFPASPTAGKVGTTSTLEDGDFTPLVVKDAYIDNINAAKIQAGTVLSGQVLVGGRTLSSITEANGDPGVAINEGTTLIDPGRIRISGGTTLADWKAGGDSTEINGSRISAGSIRSNSLSVGLRNLEFSGLTFTPNKDTNTVTWTSGSIDYLGPAGAVVTETIAAGAAAWAGETVYLYWKRAQGTLAATTQNAIHGDGDAIVLGNYTGGSRLFVNYGQTVIDGENIRTGSINADRIQGRSIKAEHLSVSDTLITSNAQIGRFVVNEANILESATLDAYIRNLSADKIRGGSITGQYLQVGGGLPGQPAHFGSVFIEGRGGNRNLSYFDTAGIVRVHIGQWGAASTDRTLDGLYVRDASGRNILSANGLGVEIVDTGNIGLSAITAMATSPSNALGFAATVTGATMLAIAYVRWLSLADPAFNSSVSLRLAYRVGGVHVADSTIGIVGAGGTTTHVAIPLVVRPAVLGAVEFRLEVLAATWIWVGNDPNTTSTIVAQEFKR